MALRADLVGGGDSEATVSLDMRAIRFIVDVLQPAGFAASGTGYGAAICGFTGMVATRMDAFKRARYPSTHGAARSDHRRHHVVLRGRSVRAYPVQNGARTRF